MPDTTSDTAVLMLGFGGPESPEQVRPFIQAVTQGRNVPDERVDSVVEQYELIGGRSPFNALTQMQAAALSAQLAARNLKLPVTVGYLFSEPSIEGAVKQLETEGIRHIIVIIMAPHKTEASYNRYLNAMQKALEQWSGRTPTVTIAKQWNQDENFIEAIASRIRNQVTTLRDSFAVVFTAHSVPEQMSNQSNYAGQILDTARLVVDKLKTEYGDFNWCIGYQSRSGAPDQAWLEPDIKDRLAELKAKGTDNVVVCPIGFVCDHVEVLFDLDILARQTADQLGIRMFRAGTVGDHPAFITTLTNLVSHSIESAHAKSDRQ